MVVLSEGGEEVVVVVEVFVDDCVFGEGRGQRGLPVRGSGEFGVGLRGERAVVVFDRGEVGLVLSHRGATLEALDELAVFADDPDGVRIVWVDLYFSRCGEACQTACREAC